MKKKYFNYIIILGVLIIPFMYSFFYLKAYWNPYGEGNIDNLPVGIVNLDKGSRGEELVKEIKDSKKLKIKLVSEDKASDGLYNKDYYALITIPEDFTKDMESASEENRTHATITYSPNQKSNYLASQIINSVVNEVEKNLDNSVNSAIVEKLSDNIESVPTQLDTVSKGLGDLQEGTGKIQDGSSSLTNGVNSLESNYDKFNEGVKSIKEGTDKLVSATNEFSSLNASFGELKNGVNELEAGSNEISNGLNSYVNGVNSSLDFALGASQYIMTMYKYSKSKGQSIPNELESLYQNSLKLNATIEGTDMNTIDYLKASGKNLIIGNSQVNGGIKELNQKVSGLDTVSNKLGELQQGIKDLNGGANTLYNSSLQIRNGINTLDSGTNTLNQGIVTLNNSVKNAKIEMDNNISKTKDEVKKVETLSQYSEKPVNVETKPVNEVSSYGTAFAPFFISIALWVGCLMMLIVFYYDKRDRFVILGMNNKNKIQRTICYHGLATISAIVLGILLNWLLDFEIVNMWLYFVVIVLVANLFMAIVEFLIINFDDIGKFIALLLLVLQLAAAGGTFPIETVTKGFRWLNNIVPMKYTIDLLREVLMKFESNLFTKNILVVIVLLAIFLVINLIRDTIKEDK